MRWFILVLISTSFGYSGHLKKTGVRLEKIPFKLSLIAIDKPIPGLKLLLKNISKKNQKYSFQGQTAKSYTRMGDLHFFDFNKKPIIGLGINDYSRTDLVTLQIEDFKVLKASDEIVLYQTTAEKNEKDQWIFIWDNTRFTLNSGTYYAEIHLKMENYIKDILVSTIWGGPLFTNQVELLVP